MSLRARLQRRFAPALEKGLRAVPAVNRRIEAEFTPIMAELETSLKPYRGDYAAYARLPKAGRDRAELLREVAELQQREEARWRDGFVSGAVYHGDPAHIDFLNRVYALTSQTNPLPGGAAAAISSKIGYTSGMRDSRARASSA